MCYFLFPLKLLTFCSTWVQSEKSPPKAHRSLCQDITAAAHPFRSFCPRWNHQLSSDSLVVSWGGSRAPRGRLRVRYVVVTVGAGGEAAGAAVSRPRRPSPLTAVYFCRAPPFIFTRVLMSILICLWRCFRWVIGECVGTCENSLCLVLRPSRCAHNRGDCASENTHSYEDLGFCIPRSRVVCFLG